MATTTRSITPIRSAADSASAACVPTSRASKTRRFHLLDSETHVARQPRLPGRPGAARQEGRLGDPAQPARAAPPWRGLIRRRERLRSLASRCCDPRLPVCPSSNAASPSSRTVTEKTAGDETPAGTRRGSDRLVRWRRRNPLLHRPVPTSSPALGIGAIVVLYLDLAAVPPRRDRGDSRDSRQSPTNAVSPSTSAFVTWTLLVCRRDRFRAGELLAPPPPCPPDAQLVPHRSCRPRLDTGTVLRRLAALGARIRGDDGPLAHHRRLGGPGPYRRRHGGPRPDAPRAAVERQYGLRLGNPTAWQGAVLVGSVGSGSAGTSSRAEITTRAVGATPPAPRPGGPRGASGLLLEDASQLTAFWVGVEGEQRGELGLVVADERHREEPGAAADRAVARARRACARRAMTSPEPLPTKHARRDESEPLEIR